MVRLKSMTNSSNPSDSTPIYLSSAMDYKIVLTTPFLLVAVAYLIAASAANERTKKAKLPIVPYILPWLGNFFEFRQDPIRFMQSCKYVLSSITSEMLSVVNVVRTGRDTAQCTRFYWPDRRLLFCPTTRESPYLIKTRQAPSPADQSICTL